MHRIATVLAALLLGLVTHLGVAGECQQAIRPLLLQTTPDPESLEIVRGLCAQQAEAGDPDALYQLSLLYLGLIDWDPDRATPMIQQAAEAGVPEAQYWLAWQYEAGPLLTDDHAVALQWYRVAGEGDHPMALHRLADAHERGELGLPVDREKAMTLRARAEACERDGG